MTKSVSYVLLLLSFICFYIDISRGWTLTKGYVINRARKVEPSITSTLCFNLQLKTDVKPKTDKKTAPITIPGVAQPAVEPEGIPGLFKETRDIQKEFNEYSEALFYVVLFDDPVNKRAYVAQCLMEVFGWDLAKAESIMLLAHNFGYAVTGEWPKDVAESYCTALLDKGLHAEVHPVEQGED